MDITAVCPHCQQRHFLKEDLRGTKVQCLNERCGIIFTAIEAHPAPDLAALIKPTRVRWLIFYLACITSFLLYLHRYSWGVIKVDVQQEMGLTKTELGWLDSAFLLPYALGQVPVGLASDLLGPRLLLSLSVLLWTTMLGCIAVVSGYWVIAAVQALFGLGQSGTYPILGKLTQQWFPRSVRTGVQGTVTAMGRLGAAAAPLIVATLLIGSLGLTWRQAILVIAIPGLILTGAVCLLVRGRPAEHSRVNPAEEQLIAGDDPIIGTTGPARFQVRRDGIFTFVMMLIYSFLSTFADMLYPFWIPLFLREGRGLTATEMGLFAPLPLLGGAAGGILGGLLNDAMLRWTGNRRWSRVAVACTGKSLAAGLMALSVLVPDGRMAMLVLLACKFFGDWSQPTQWGTLTDIGGRASATVFAMANTMGSIGGFVANPVLGSLAQHTGWEGMFFCVAAVYLASALSWFFIDCTRKLVD